MKELKNLKRLENQISANFSFLYSPVFKLHQQSSIQKVSPWSGKPIGAYQMGVRAAAHALSGTKDVWEMRFFIIFIMAGAHLLRAQPRKPPCDAWQSILLIKEMLFDYLIASAAQKLADIAQIQVRAKLLVKWGGLRPISAPGAQHGINLPLTCYTTLTSELSPLV